MIEKYHQSFIIYKRKTCNKFLLLYRERFREHW